MNDTRGPRARNSRRSATRAAIVLIAASALSLGAFEARADDDHDDSAASIDSVQVYDSATREIFELIKCPCRNCGGKSIGRCNPTCGEGRRDRARVVELVDEGRSQDEIIDIFVAERGDAVLMNPPNKGFNILSWALPIGGMLLAVPMIILFVRRNARGKKSDDVNAPAQSAPPSGEALKTVAASAPLAGNDEDEDRLDELERQLEMLD